MNTLEIRSYEYVLWRNHTPLQVRDRMYPSVHLSQMGYPQGSLDPQLAYCQGWMVDGIGVVLVEIPQKD